MGNDTDDAAVLERVMTSEEKDWDIWRDSPLRYVGYANEVGEAFAPMYRKILLPSYGCAMAYVLGETYHKSFLAFSAQVANADSSRGTPVTVDYKKIAIEAGDSFTWQMLASVSIPGLTIKGVAKAAGAFINHPQIKVSISKKGRLLFPTAIGLTTIPFIIEPIDHLVDIIMDRTYRAYFSPK